MATLVSSWGSENRDGENYSNWASNSQYYGQSFTATSGRLYSAKFMLKKVGTLSGNLTAQLWSHTGTLGDGTTSVGTGTVLATSDALVANTVVTTSMSVIEFFFTGNERYQLLDGTNYVITFYWPGVGSDINNRILVGTDNTPGHAGNLARRTGAGSWDAEAVDCIFYVYKLSGTVGDSIQNNMNAVAGTTGLSVQGAANSLAGTTGLSTQAALATAYSKTGSIQDIINQQIADGTTYSVQDGLGRL